MKFILAIKGLITTCEVISVEGQPGSTTCPFRATSLSLLPWGWSHIKDASLLHLHGHRELRGDRKRLVREAGGNSPWGTVPVDDAGTEHQPSVLAG